MSAVGMNSLAWYIGDRGGGGGPVQAGYGRDGLGAARFTVAGGSDSLPFSWPGGNTRQIVGGWLKTGEAGVWSASGIDVLEWNGVSNMPLSLATGASGGLEVWKHNGVTDTMIASAPGALASPDSYYHVEMRVDWSTTVGAVQVRVMGNPVITLTGQNLINNVAASAVEHGPFNYYGSSTPCKILWDDVYYLDGAGSTFNDFLGVSTVPILRPIADGTYQNWTPSTGTAHYAVVDELPHNGNTGSDHVSIGPSPAGFKVDTYTYETIVGSPSDPVPAVQLCLVGKNIRVPTISVAITGQLKVGADEISPTFANVSNFWRPMVKFYGNNPLLVGTPDWTLADVNAMEFGPRAQVVTATTSEPAITGSYLEVLWPTPPSTARKFSFGSVVG